jgi:uncharacterized phiE125 gp8 family phage protein
MPIIRSSLPGNPTDGNRQFSVITSPSVEPISLTELKTFGRIDGTDEDTLITGFIEAARLACENYLGRALIKQKIRVYLDYWPGMEIELPRPPLVSVEGVYTVDEDDVLTLYENTNYFVVDTLDPAKLVIKNGCTPPSNTDRYTAGYLIDFWAGYGDASTDVPALIKEGMKLWVMQIYEQRTLTPDPPPDARCLLEQYRLIRY